MYRSLSISAAALFLVTVTACGGGDPSGSGGQNGGTTESTSTSGGTASGSGKPAHATSDTCSKAEDCGDYHCSCEDGFIVNSSVCTNGYCMDQTIVCPDACPLLKHGKWTGTYGGPDKPSSTTSTSSGGSQQCGTNGTACGVCLANNCCNQTFTCNNSQVCKDYVACIATCAGDSFCIENCANAHPEGVSAGNAFQNCADANCVGPCG